MIQIDVPPPTLRPPERDLSVPLPPDVRSLYLLSSPRGGRRVQPFLPMLTKWWGVRFAGNKALRSAKASKGSAVGLFGQSIGKNLRAKHHTIAPFLFGLVHCNVCTP